MTTRPAIAPLHPEAQHLLERLHQWGIARLSEVGVAQARAASRVFTALQGPAEPVGEAYDVVVPGPAGGICARVYRPAGHESSSVLVYFHGGGWVIGDLAVVDTPCRALANATRCVVVSVEYRLSPETRFPGAVEDCYAVTRWVHEHASELGADRSLLAVAGDSAGGNLAAAVALVARDHGTPPLGLQLLIYPSTAPPPEGDGDDERGLFTSADLRWCWQQYLGSAQDAWLPYASPLVADSLAGLPPALVVTCGLDPLREQGRAYAEGLRRAGVPVMTRHYADMLHGFFWMGGALDRFQDLLEDLALAVRSRRTAAVAVARRQHPNAASVWDRVPSEQ